MQTKLRILINTLIIIFLILFIIITGHISNYLLYNNKQLVISTSNNILQNQESLKNESLNKYHNLEYNYIIGRVIERNIHNFYNEIIINLGSKDNITEQDAVINEEGLIGIVYEVYENYSRVKLLTSNFNLSVSINDTYGNLNNGKVTLLDKYSNLQEGDSIYTSIYSKVPSHIYVGKIAKVNIGKDTLGKEVTVSLINTLHLNYIAVIRGSK